MLEWLKTNAVIITVLALLLGGAITYGRMEQHVADIKEIELRLEDKVDKMDDRLRRVEINQASMQSYLQYRDNGYSGLD